jgi:NAD+ synthase
MIKLQNLEKFIDVSIDEMKNYFQKCNLHAAVLGISGGIDSTLVAALMYQVSKELNNDGYPFTFYGISLPTKTTDKKELWVSQLVGHAFCDEFKVDDNMDEIGSVLVDWLGDWKQDKIEPLRSGNAKSRLRMIYLYDYAKKVNGIVMGTDNYTEYLLGFSTIGGDALFDYNPIQELWKSEVFEVSKIIANDFIALGQFTKASAIQESLALKPMDGLGISSDDMEQIGARNYYDVDDILQWYLEHKDEPGYPEYIVSTIDNFSISYETMEKVINRHKNSDFKRNHPVFISRAKYF